MSDDIHDDEPAREDWDSGPFCPHFSDPHDCEELCKCGHQCRKHWRGEDCQADDCDCEEFTEVDE